MSSNRKEKIVGILGGMGPYATVDFFKQILDCTSTKKDWEHLRILIDNNVKIPSRTRAILYGEESPVPMMIKSIDNLAQIGADLIAIPCNSAHYFYGSVNSKIGIPWLNLIEITSNKIKKLNRKKPLILGGYVTIKKELYDEYLDDLVYLSEEENKKIFDIIEEIKLTNNLSDKSKKIFEKIVKNNDSDCIVLACTELPIVYKESSLFGKVLINSNLEYAKEIIRYAKM